MPICSIWKHNKSKYSCYPAPLLHAILHILTSAKVRTKGKQEGALFHLPTRLGLGHGVDVDVGSGVGRVGVGDVS